MKKKKRPRDPNQLAASIVADATGENHIEEQPTTVKNPAAVELGRLGGLKGGAARAAKLTKEQRSEIARNAARARHSKKEGNAMPKKKGTKIAAEVAPPKGNKNNKLPGYQGLELARGSQMVLDLAAEATRR